MGRSLRHAETHVQIMLIKHAKPSYRKWLKRGAVVAFVVEGIFFVAGYTVWTKVNTERGIHDNLPFPSRCSTFDFRF